MPLTRHNLSPKTDLRMRVKDQLQAPGEVHVGDAVGEGGDVVVASDKMVQHRDLEVVETPPRQKLPQHPLPLLQSHQLLTRLKAQETPETDGTEEETEVLPEVLPEAQSIKVEVFSQWGLDDNLVAD